MGKYDDKKGVWRTIRGRRIFIKSGESLGSAMSKSGKFKREDIREGKKDEIISSGLRKKVKNDNKYGDKKDYKIDRKNNNKIEKRYPGIVKDNQAEKNRINENANIEGSGKTRVQRNWNRYSEEQRREVRHEQIQKKLADYKAKKKGHAGLTLAEEERVRKNDLQIRKQESLNKSTLQSQNDKAKNEIEKFKAKKQSNNKIDEKKYDSVVDRYNKDEKFRDTLKKEHDKTIEATRKEVKSFLQDKNFFDRKGIKTEDDLYNTINDNYYNISRDDFDKIYKEEYNKNAKEAYDTRQREGLDKFIQRTDMYGGEYEYSKEDLKRMEEQGIRPMAHSYTGGGWEGVNSHKNLSTSEQAKAITSEIKKQFPDVKIARKSDIYSGGSSIDFNIMSSDKDLFVSDKEIDKMEDFGNITSSYEWERWAKANVKDYEKTHSYWDSDKRKYAKEILTNLKKRDVQSVRGNEWFLSDYGKKVVSALNKEANSYTYSDNDGMVDYFNHGTYMHISIGKWDKPYQVNDVKAKVDAYKKRKGK